MSRKFDSINEYRQAVQDAREKDKSGYNGNMYQVAFSYDDMDFILNEMAKRDSKLVTMILLGENKCQNCGHRHS